MPPPTLPIGDMKRICCNFPSAIFYAVVQLRVTLAAIPCMIRRYSTPEGSTDRMCQRSVWICKEQAFWLVSGSVLRYILTERKDMAVSSL
jgi:hypothetical protein